jgi:23S rRNA (uracil1939-C5)-methyltransferase
MSKLNLRTDTLQIEKLVYGGAGLSRHEGQVYLVPKTAPGESVVAATTKSKANFSRASLIEVLSPAPERVAPPCPHFAACGGCHFQHLPYELQLHWKREILRELFERAKLTLDVAIETIASEPLGYRNRTQFHFHDGKVGFLEEGSHRLVPIEGCPVSSPKINEVFVALQRMARNHRFPKFLKSLEVFTDEQQVQFNVVETNQPLAKHFFQWLANEVPGVRDGAITYKAYGYEWKVSYRSFFQVNRFLIDALTDHTLGQARGGEARGAHAMDLYAGVGLFSLPLARRFERVTAVESGKVAMYDLEANAKSYSVPNIRIVQASVDAFLADFPVTDRPDVIIADPPRSGLGKIATEHLARIQAPMLRLVSCDPSTLVRDLAPLFSAGYRMQAIQLIDLFPQTYHMETICTLVL